MKGVKCFGVLSVLFIMVCALFVPSSSANALKHNLTGVELGYRHLGFAIDNGDGTYRYQTQRPSDSNYYPVNYNGVINLYATGSAFYPEFENYKLSNNFSFLNLYKDGESCSVNTNGGAIRTMNNLQSVYYSNTKVGAYYSLGYYLELFSPETAAISSNSSDVCRIHDKFGVNKPSFNSGSLNNIVGYLTCGMSNGASCSGIWDARDYINNEILPDYFYTTDGIYFNKSIQSVDGNVYSNNFSFNQVFDGDYDYISKFSHLSFPIGNIDYFTNSDNLYTGRQFKFTGSIMFEGSFTWNPSIQETGSFSIYFSGMTKYGSSVSRSYQCSTNLVDVPSASYRELQYTCEFSLDSSYLYFFPFIIIDNTGSNFDSNDSYVWETNARWYFNSSFWVTDNDETLGNSFDPEITGGSHAAGAPYLPEDSPGTVSDFFDSLVNLFHFNFINPFSPLFDMFNSGETCASIPTLAGMLHSEESTVCPWFDSSIRNIVTPVLSIASMMLIFGFAVRWLGSSSGNMMTDSANEEVSNQGGKWGHFKKGGT